MVYEFAKRTGKTDPDDYYEEGRWRTRRGASGLKVKNVTIADTACNLSDRARNIIVEKRLQKDVIELFKPLGDLKIVEKKMLHIYRFLTMISLESIEKFAN